MFPYGSTGDGVLLATDPPKPPRFAIIPPIPASPVGVFGVTVGGLFLSSKRVELVMSAGLLLAGERGWFPGPFGKCVAMRGDGS